MLSFVLFFVIPMAGWVLSECFVSPQKRLKIVGWTGLLLAVVLFGAIWDIWVSIIMAVVFLLEMIWFVCGKDEKISVKNGLLKVWSHIKI